MTELKIISVNCQGLGDFKKRKDIFQYYRKTKCNILCLQDTHFTAESEKDIRYQWGFDAYFSSFTSNSRGVAILLNNNFEYKVIQQRRDNSGNMLALSISIDNKMYTLIVIYAPNDDSPDFFHRLFQVIDDFNNSNVVVVGDYNLVIDTKIDYYNYLHINNPRGSGKGP